MAYIKRNDAPKMVAGTIREIGYRPNSYAVYMMGLDGKQMPVMFMSKARIDKYVCELCYRHGLCDVKTARDFDYFMPGSMIFGTCNINENDGRPVYFLTDAYVCPPDENISDRDVFRLWESQFLKTERIVVCDSDSDIEDYVDITASAQTNRSLHITFWEQRKLLRNTHILTFYCDVYPVARQTYREHLNIYRELHMIVRIGHDMHRKNKLLFSIQDMMAMRDIFQFSYLQDPMQMYLVYLQNRENRGDRLCKSLIEKNSPAALVAKLVLLYDHGTESFMALKLVHVLEDFMMNHDSGGHTCIPMKCLCSRFKTKLSYGKDIPDSHKSYLLDRIENDDNYIQSILLKNTELFHVYVKECGTQWVYLGHVWKKECFVFEYLKEAITQVNIMNSDIDSYSLEARRHIERIEEESGMYFTGQQKETLVEMLTMAISREQGGLFCLTGLPGTGKSFVVSKFKEICKDLKIDVLTCAPSAKAATRTQGVTIHRFIKQVEDIRKNNVSDSEIDRFHSSLDIKQVMILDEVSMLDIQLAYYFLEACRKKGNNMYIIFVGDPHQLEPIGHGDFLGALLSAGSDNIPHHFLTEVKRQANKDSLISKLARSIFDDTMSINDVINEAVSSKQNEVKWALYGNDTPRHKRHAQIYEWIHKLYKRHKDDCVILSCKKDAQDILGTFKINQFIHESFHKNEDGKIYSEGERVFVTKNVTDPNTLSHVKTHASNGDMGYFMYYTDGDMKKAYISLDSLQGGREKRVLSVACDILDYGHACTVHRMQGSDHNVVILVIDREHKHMLTREMLYTAITRAKNKLIILADQDTFLKCKENAVQKRRIDLLSYRINHDILDMIPHERAVENQQTNHFDDMTF